MPYLQVYTTGRSRPRYLACLVIGCLLFSHYLPAQNPSLISYVETYDVVTHERQVVYEEDGHLEAPNWSPDGSYLLVNSGGKLYRVPIAGGGKTLVPTGFADKCNNDHGISPDGRQIVISNNGEPGTPSEEQSYLDATIYLLPIEGGEPKRVTTETPSFWHGWSPDGSTLAYVGRRDGEWSLYTIPVAGGEEEAIAPAPGLQDGPDYGHDGRYLYYNSFESGSMEIWRIATDGGGKEQLTDDQYSNWFAHPSPDGKGLVFISYLDDQGEEHPALKAVALRYYDLADGSIDVLATFVGGQGTINVPSWRSDGRKFAFVRYGVK